MTSQDNFTKTLLSNNLTRRAQVIADRISPFLPGTGVVLDIGSGTGHNACELRRRTGSRVIELDVTNMSTLGSPPLLFDGEHLPFPDDAVKCALMLFVLHYPEDPVALLREAHRVVTERMIVLQSTYSGPGALAVLRCRDALQGRLVFQVARCVGLIGNCECSLVPRRFFDRERLERSFSDARWEVVHHQPQKWPLLNLSRDLYVLERS